MNDQKEIVIVVVPAFNEEDTIGNILGPLQEAVDSGVIHDYVIVNDGSTDRTNQILEKSGSHLITFEKNLGKSTAIEAGIDYCKHKDATFVVFLDADISDLTPEKINNLVEPLRKNLELSMVVANQIEGKNEEGYTEEEAMRYNGNRAFRFEDLLKAYNDKYNWDPFVKNRIYLEAGMFLIFGKRKTFFVEDVTFHTREMCRDEIETFKKQNKDINAVQKELGKRIQEFKKTGIDKRLPRFYPNDQKLR